VVQGGCLFGGAQFFACRVNGGRATKSALVANFARSLFARRPTLLREKRGTESVLSNGTTTLT